MNHFPWSVPADLALLDGSVIEVYHPAAVSIRVAAVCPDTETNKYCVARNGTVTCFGSNTVNLKWKGDSEVKAVTFSDACQHSRVSRSSPVFQGHLPLLFTTGKRRQTYEQSSYTEFIWRHPKLPDRLNKHNPTCYIQFNPSVTATWQPTTGFEAHVRKQLTAENILVIFIHKWSQIYMKLIRSFCGARGRHQPSMGVQKSEQKDQKNKPGRG